MVSKVKLTMSKRYFADVVDSYVENVVVVDDSFDIFKDPDGNVDETQIQKYLNKIKSSPKHTWIETSKDPSQLGFFSSKGYKYDPDTQKFIKPRPFPSWTFNEETWTWDPPVPRPPIGNGIAYAWDEESQTWQEFILHQE